MREILVCFAVKEEAAPFKQRAGSMPGVKILLTGIGRRNAEAAISAALARQKPSFVFSSGFAGGLNPELATGTVACSVDSDMSIVPMGYGARMARFHCAERIVTNAAEKRQLYEATGADAVEMESQFIRAVCREQLIPSATVRVILDTADENLPLDFNRLLDSQQEMDYGKLALGLLRSPSAIPPLLRLHKQTQVAARRLGEVLAGCTLTLAEAPEYKHS